MAAVDMLCTIGASKHATRAQMALAWLLAIKPCIVPIPRINSIKSLDEDIRSTDIEMTPDDLRQIENAHSKMPVQGDQLFAVHIAFINR